MQVCQGFLSQISNFCKFLTNSLLVLLTQQDIFQIGFVFDKDSYMGCCNMHFLLKASETRTEFTVSDSAPEIAPSITTVSSVPSQDLMEQPHIITGRENSDGYFKDKVHLLQEQQRDTSDGNILFYPEHCTLFSLQ